VTGKCLDLLVGEWFDNDCCEHTPSGEFSDGAGEGGVLIKLAVAISSHKQHMSIRLAACQVTQQVKTGRIHPVQIIEEEDECTREANRLQEGSYCFIEAKACLLRR
jgi:hypothetical protein